MLETVCNILPETHWPTLLLSYDNLKFIFFRHALILGLTAHHQNVNSTTAKYVNKKLQHVEYDLL